MYKWWGVKVTAHSNGIPAEKKVNTRENRKRKTENLFTVCPFMLKWPCLLSTFFLSNHFELLICVVSECWNRINWSRRRRTFTQLHTQTHFFTRNRGQNGKNKKWEEWREVHFINKFYFASSRYANTNKIYAAYAPNITYIVISIYHPYLSSSFTLWRIQFGWLNFWHCCFRSIYLSIYLYLLHHSFLIQNTPLCLLSRQR